MAIIQPTIEKMTRTAVRIRWDGLTEADSGAPYEFPHLSDKTVHIFGAFGGGGCTLYGSCNTADLAREPSSGSSTWKPVSNVDGLGDIAATATLLAQILENPSFMAPEVTSGTSVSLSVVIEAQTRKA